MNEKELKKQLDGTTVYRLDLIGALQLGCALGELNKKIDFYKLVAFLNGDTDHFEGFDELKPLFEKFGYLTVKQAILICGITTQWEELNK